MIQYFFDTSALVKRYHKETGTAAVNDLVDNIVNGSATGIVSSLLMPELISTINRKRNQGLIAKPFFEAIKKRFFEELGFFRLLAIDDQQVLASIPLIIRHNLNSADALHLVAALSVPATPRDKPVFVSCDSRLLSAAQKEKLNVLNPEITTVPTFSRINSTG